MKPSFQRLWNEFPTHAKYPNMEALYEALGGQAERNIYKQGFGPDGNTCASRLSVAFNKAGVPISAAIANAVGAKMLETADGSRIIYRVAEFRRYLIKILGNPVVDKTRPHDDEFRGKAGIIAFSVNWGGATGHVALWNGFAYREPAYDNYASYVNAASPNIHTSLGELWELMR